MLLIFLTIPRPPLSTLFPYTTLFRSRGLPQPLVVSVHRSGPGEVEHGPEQHRGVTIRERSEEHTSELQSHSDLVCRLLLEKKKSKCFPSLFSLYWWHGSYCRGWQASS